MPNTPYYRDALVTTLVYHQRTDIKGCGCGWAKLGHSHPEHVADVYEQFIGERERVSRDRWRQALLWIGTHCENLTEGRCWDGGLRAPDAEYGADKWCAGCLAAWGLGEGPDQ
jgi:hypothetical protein